MKNKKTTVIAAIILAVLIIGAACARFLLKPAVAEGAKTITVNVHHLDGTEASFVLKTDAEYLREPLDAEGLIQGTESTYGLWIETVDGETADSELEQWWGFDVNGEMALFGVDTQPIYDGDIIDFTLNEGY